MNDIDKAIEEFYDHAFHESLKPDISEESKAIALKSMLVRSEFEEWLDKAVKSMRGKVDSINMKTENGNHQREIICEELRLQSKYDTLRMIKNKLDELQNSI